MGVHDKYYDQKGNAVTIGGVAFQDFSDGEAIRWTPAADIASITQGLDGATMSLANSSAYTVEIDLKETSVSNAQAARHASSQQAGVFLDLPGTIVTGSGAVHSFTGGAIQTRAPGSTGGPALGKRTWKYIFTTHEGDR
jgi:hypothetical protein